MSPQKLGALFEKSSFMKEKYFFDTDSADFWPCTMYINTKFAVVDKVLLMLRKVSSADSWVVMITQESAHATLISIKRTLILDVQFDNLGKMYEKMTRYLLISAKT